MRFYADAARSKLKARFRLGDTVYFDHYIQLHLYSKNNVLVMSKVYMIKKVLSSGDTEEYLVATPVPSSTRYDFTKDVPVLLSTVHESTPSFTPTDIGQYVVRSTVQHAEIGTRTEEANFTVTRL